MDPEELGHVDAAHASGADGVAGVAGSHTPESNRERVQFAATRHGLASGLAEEFKCHQPAASPRETRA
jgi:hypothetical protein